MYNNKGLVDIFENKLKIKWRTLNIAIDMTT
jgi:hypothetical protein